MHRTQLKAYVKLIVQEATRKKMPKRKERSYLPLRSDSTIRRQAKGDAWQMNRLRREQERPITVPAVVITPEQAQSRLDDAVKQFASNWTGACEERDDCESIVADAALGFFSRYPDWIGWARALRLTRDEVYTYVKDFVYEAMLQH